MQTFSPTLLADAAGKAFSFSHAASAWEALRAGASPGMLGMFFGASLVAGALAIWVASIVVARESATADRAAKVFLAWVGLAIVLVAAAGVGLPRAAAAGRTELVLMACAFGGLGLAGLLGVPMAVYGFGFTRSAGFCCIYLLLAGAAHAGLQFALPGRGPTQHAEGFRRIFPPPTPSPAEQAAIRVRLRERQSTLARRYAALEIRRRHLPAGDAQALRDYEREKAAYKRELEQLQSDAAELDPSR
ncbi:MAG: hypothetical protein ABMA13_20745 [Chthoniobacteraceae bacterium]